MAWELQRQVGVCVPWDNTACPPVSTWNTVSRGCHDRDGSRMGLVLLVPITGVGTCRRCWFKGVPLNIHPDGLPPPVLSLKASLASRSPQLRSQVLASSLTIYTAVKGADDPLHQPPTGRRSQECWPGLGRPHMKAQKPVRNFYPPGGGGGKGGMSPGNHPPFPSLSGTLGLEN